MLNHYITKYTDVSTNKRYACSWIQLDLFGRHKCFSIKTKEI